MNITSSDEEHWNDRLNWLDTSLNDWFKRLSFDRIYFNYGDYKGWLTAICGSIICAESMILATMWYVRLVTAKDQDRGSPFE